MREALSNISKHSHLVLVPQQQTHRVVSVSTDLGSSAESPEEASLHPLRGFLSLPRRSGARRTSRSQPARSRRKQKPTTPSTRTSPHQQAQASGRCFDLVRSALPRFFQMLLLGITSSSARTFQTSAFLDRLVVTQFASRVCPLAGAQQGFLCWFCSCHLSVAWITRYAAVSVLSSP